MKFATRTEGKEKWNFILLENIQDVIIYKNINEQIKAKQSINLYFGFKSQKYHDNLSNYASHEAEGDNSMAHVMPIAIEAYAHVNNKDRISLVDYCNISDSITNSIHTSMLEMINNSKTIRVNYRGGFCSVLSDDIFDAVIEINELELYNYLLHKNIDIDFKITSSTIVIENDNYVPKELIQKYINQTGASPDDLQVITSFKQKTLLFKQADWFNFFRIGRENGLSNIVFKTTGQDMRQIYGIRDILQALARSNQKFNIFVHSWRIEEMLSKLDYDKEKITINILK